MLEEYEANMNHTETHERRTYTNSVFCTAQEFQELKSLSEERAKKIKELDSLLNHATMKFETELNRT